MTELLHLQEKIRMTSAAIGRLEMELSKDPNSRSINSNLISLRRLHGELRTDFQEQADFAGLDVCHYRMLDDRPTARGFSKAIGSFQEAFSLAFDALRNGPKSRRNVDPDAALKTELRIAYSYPGSFGVVFTIPNSRLMWDLPTYLDEAVKTVFSVAQAKDDTKPVAAAARQVGRAPIAAIYDWAKGNARNELGASIQWTRESAVREAVTIQVPEFRALSESLERTSETSTVEERIIGTLVGADTRTRRFHFIADGASQSIKGRFLDAISESQQARLPARYAAVISKTSEVSYATEAEKTSFFLVRLEDANPTAPLSFD